MGDGCTVASRSAALCRVHMFTLEIMFVILQKDTHARVDRPKLTFKLGQNIFLTRGLTL